MLRKLLHDFLQRLLERRIKIGKSVTFPSLFAHIEYNAVTALTTRHLLKLDGFNPQMLRNDFQTSLEYVKNVRSKDQDVRYAALVVNYLPPAGSNVSMKIEKVEVVLVWVESDVIRDHRYDNYYIAAWGSDAPVDEIRGVISPEILPELSSHYYVELRLRPTELNLMIA